MGSINQLSFLPDDYLERKAQRRTNAICAVLFVLVLAGVATAFTLSERATRRVEDEYAKIEADYIGKAKLIDQANEMREKRKRMAHQAELSASLLETVRRSVILGEITNALPPGVSLLDFTLDSKAKDEPQTAAAGKTTYEQRKAARQQNTAGKGEPAPLPPPKSYITTMKLTGVATADAQVWEFLGRLTRNRFFSEVNPLTNETFTLNGGNASKKTNEPTLRKFQFELILNNDVDVESESRPKLANVEVKEN